MSTTKITTAPISREWTIVPDWHTHTPYLHLCPKHRKRHSTRYQHQALESAIFGTRDVTRPTPEGKWVGTRSTKHHTPLGSCPMRPEISTCSMTWTFSSA